MSPGIVRGFSVVVDAALATLEAKLAGFIDLSVDERRTLSKMGDKSEAFCRQTLTVLAQNPQVVPSGLDALRQDMSARFTRRASGKDHQKATVAP